MRARHAHAPSARFIALLHAPAVGPALDLLHDDLHHRARCLDVGHAGLRHARRDEGLELLVGHLGRQVDLRDHELLLGLVGEVLAAGRAPPRSSP